MATLMPSLSSDEEDIKNQSGLIDDSESDEDDNEVNQDFEFGGILVSFRGGGAIVLRCDA